MSCFPRWAIKFGIILLGLVLIVSCSAKPELSAEESVKVRAGERWQALIEGKFEKAYAYEVPEYRKVFDLEQYRRGFHGVGIWKKAEVVDVACMEKCVVTMRIYVTINFARWGEAMDTSSLLKEQWMRDTGSGEWFHLSSE
ncbi:MAG: hypothetical protein ABL903_03260 [Methylococcales bacterium]